MSVRAGSGVALGILGEIGIEQGCRLLGGREGVPRADFPSPGEGFGSDDSRALGACQSGQGIVPGSNALGHCDQRGQQIMRV